MKSLNRSIAMRGNQNAKRSAGAKLKDAASTGLRRVAKTLRIGNDVAGGRKTLSQAAEGMNIGSKQSKQAPRSPASNRPSKTSKKITGNLERIGAASLLSGAVTTRQVDYKDAAKRLGNFKRSTKR